MHNGEKMSYFKSYVTFVAFYGQDCKFKVNFYQPLAYYELKQLWILL